MTRLSLRLLALVAVGSLATAGCADQRPERPQTLDIMAEDYEFTAPDTVSSGWTTLRMHNQGSEHHLVTLVRLPDRVTYEDVENEVVAPFDSVWSLVLDGTIDREEAGKRLRSLLPDWYPDEAPVRGGVGLTAPGRTGQTTVDLEPGTYVMECFVRTSEGQFHALRGMYHPLTVVPGQTGGEPPPADQRLTVANRTLNGVGPLSAGARTIAVQFETDVEESPRQHLYLARLDEGTDADELAEWMVLDPVMPAPVEFVGGVQQLPADHTGYVTVELEPGRYAWVVAVPPNQGEVQAFAVE